MVFQLGVLRLRREEEEEEEEEKRRRKKKQEIKGMETMYGILRLLYGIGFSNSRVLLGIHPKPRVVESWVGKTLFCIRGVWNPSFGYGFLVYGV